MSRIDEAEAAGHCAFSRSLARCRGNWRPCGRLVPTGAPAARGGRILHRDVAVAITASGDYLSGHRLADLRAAFRRAHRLAADPCRRRRAVHRHDGPASARAASKAADAPTQRGHSACQPGVHHARPVVGRSPVLLSIAGFPAASPCRCRRCTSSRIAATTLWRDARARDALADARSRHRCHYHAEPRGIAGTTYYGVSAVPQFPLHTGLCLLPTVRGCLTV